MERFAIEAAGLSRTFRDHRRLFQRRGGEAVLALSDVSFQVRTGECVALVGPNGAGKSTLLKLLATLIAPSAGSASVNGFDIHTEQRDVRRSVGMMTGDDRSFFWPLTARENLQFFGQLQALAPAEAQRRAGEVLAQVGLAESADRRVAGYSAGMRQRLNIARAIIHQPPVLLLDEPTANLDQEHRASVIELIENVVVRGDRSVLVATHDAGLVVAVADRSLRLEAGSLVQVQRVERPVAYRISVASMEPQRLASLGAVAVEDGGALAVDITDLGDGHALSWTISSIVADGGEVLGVETLSPVAVKS